MKELLEAGTVLRMTRTSSPLTVERRLGQGGQGVVYRVRLQDRAFAAKWLLPGWHAEGLRNSIQQLVARGRPPHPSFVWPIDVVDCEKAPGFGYLMRLVEPSFIPIPQMLNDPRQPSFRTFAALGREIVTAFAALHSCGLCYRDFNFGNIWVNPRTAEVAVLDNDNVGIDGGHSPVKGTGRFMAPEILRDEALPSTATDLHSLAVVLFYLLVHGHPLIGAHVDRAYTWNTTEQLPEGQVLLDNLGRHPLFVFDPDNPANRPAPGDPMPIWWNIYPDFLRQVFTQAFTTGLHTTSVQGRVTEGVWLRTLLRLHDCVDLCQQCRAGVFHDPDNPRRPCWSCHTTLPAPPLARLPAGTLVLSEGAVVTRHHLTSDRAHNTACAAVEAHPQQPGLVVLRNLGDHPWHVLPDDEPAKTVQPGQRLAVRPMTIDFRLARGRITTVRPAVP